MRWRPLGNRDRKTSAAGLLEVENRTVNALTVYGVLALTFMMVMYALERRRPAFILAFAAGCLLSSVYGFMSGAWPFGVVELIWCGVAVGRFRTVPHPQSVGR